MNREQEEKYRAARHLSLYLVIPMLLLVSPIIGLYLGKFLDSLFHTEPILMIIFIGLGFVAGGREVYRILARIAREEEQARQDKKR